jgi:Na+-driven multidrug efflux pump
MVHDLVTLIRHKGPVRLYAKHIRLYKKETKQILHIGVPAGLQRGMYAVANVVITATVNSFGPAATTGISIANNYDGILYQVSMAASFAVLPYVSQNVGAGNVKRAIKAIWTGTLITVCMGASVGGLSAIFSGELASLLSSDPVVIGYAQQKMIIISSTYFICGIHHILSETLRGFRRPLVPTVTTLLFMCALRFVWVYVFFPHFPEPKLTYLYLVWPVGWVLSIITMLAFLIPTIRGNWQKRFNLK